MKPRLTRRLILAITFLLAIELISPFAIAANTIDWTPSVINYTIGNGQGASGPVTAGFASTESLDNVTLEVVPGLRGFVGVEPASIQHVTANSPYDVKLRFSIPPGTAQGAYTGTLNENSKRLLSLRAGGEVPLLFSIARVIPSIFTSEKMPQCPEGGASEESS